MHTNSKPNKRNWKIQSIGSHCLKKDQKKEMSQSKKKDLKRNFFLFRSISDRALHFCRCVKHIDLFSKKQTKQNIQFFPIILVVDSTIYCLGCQNLKFCWEIILILISNFDLENQVWYILGSWFESRLCNSKIDQNVFCKFSD